MFNRYKIIQGVQCAVFVCRLDVLLISLVIVFLKKMLGTYNKFLNP